jgi:hypothetical protein
MVNAKISKNGTRISGASALDGEWRILKRAMVTAVEIPNTGIVTPSATPNQPHAMQTHIVSSDQCGLKDEEEHPHAEDGCMKIEDMGERDGGMDEFFAYRAAEAEHHDNGDQNRHEEVEIVIEQAASLIVNVISSIRPDLKRIRCEWT